MERADRPSIDLLLTSIGGNNFYNPEQDDLQLLYRLVLRPSTYRPYLPNLILQSNRLYS